MSGIKFEMTLLTMRDHFQGEPHLSFIASILLFNHRRRSGALWEGMTVLLVVV